MKDRTRPQIDRPEAERRVQSLTAAVDDLYVVNIGIDGDGVATMIAAEPRDP
jgi:hypothetical protein